MSSPARTLIASAYDRAATGFARAADRLVYRRLALPLVDAVVAAGAKPGVVLDLAAGPGAFGRLFPRAVALDVSMGQLAHNPARARVLADAEVLPFPRDAFAAVGCALGINHFADPAAAVLEMARVAPIVGVSTWLRPEQAYVPKRLVDEAIERQTGRRRTTAGEFLDRLGDRIGSVDAVAALLRTAKLRPHVEVVRLDIDWPGLDAYLDYRLSMPSTAGPVDAAAIRADIERELSALSAAELVWRTALVVGVGRR